MYDQLEELYDQLQTCENAEKQRRLIIAARDKYHWSMPLSVIYDMLEEIFNFKFKE